MKIFAQVLFILLILTVLCDGNKRQKRTLNTFLRYFGFRIIPIDDVELVTENIPETTRNPKFLRIKTQRPSMRVEVEETTPMPRKTTAMRSTTTQSIPQFNPLLPDIINSMFQINLTTMRSPIDVRNSMKKTTLKPNKVKGTEFLIRPMDIPNMKSQKLTDSMMQPPPEMPQIADMMQPPSMQMSSQGMSDMMQSPMQSEMFSEFMESTTEATVNSTESIRLNNPQNSMLPNQPMDSMQSPEMQSQNGNFQSLPGFPAELQNLGSFEMVKSREVPMPQFPAQFIVGNSIAVSDFINPHQQLPFQTQFHTQFSTPHASHFTIARSGKEIKLNSYNHFPVTYYH